MVIRVGGDSAVAACYCDLPPGQTHLPNLPSGSVPNTVYSGCLYPARVAWRWEVGLPLQTHPLTLLTRPWCLPTTCCCASARRRHRDIDLNVRLQLQLWFADIPNTSTAAYSYPVLERRVPTAMPVLDHCLPDRWHFGLDAEHTPAITCPAHNVMTVYIRLDVATTDVCDVGTAWPFNLLTWRNSRDVTAWRAYISGVPYTTAFLPPPHAGDLAIIISANDIAVLFFWFPAVYMPPA